MKKKILSIDLCLSVLVSGLIIIPKQTAHADPTFVLHGVVTGQEQGWEFYKDASGALQKRPNGRTYNVIRFNEWNDGSFVNGTHLVLSGPVYRFVNGVRDYPGDVASAEISYVEYNIRNYGFWLECGQPGQTVYPVGTRIDMQIMGVYRYEACTPAGEYHTSVAATCTTAGSRYRYCSVCSGTVSETVAAKKHNFTVTSNNTSVRSNATCTTKATAWNKCSDCNTFASNSTTKDRRGVVLNTCYHQYGSVKGHNFTVTTDNSSARSDATCTTQATAWNKCSDCNTYATSSTAKDRRNVAYNTCYHAFGDTLGHTWEKSSVELESTVYGCGIQCWTCTRDGTHTTKTKIPQDSFRIYLGTPPIGTISQGGTLIYDVPSCVEDGGEAPSPPNDLTTYGTLLE